MTTDNTNAPLTAAQLQEELTKAEQCIAGLRATFDSVMRQRDRDAAAMIHDYKLALDQRDAALTAATARADSAEAERDRLRAALKPFATMWTEYQQALRDDAYYQGDLFDWLLHSVTEHAPQLDAYCERAADALAGDGEAGA